MQTAAELDRQGWLRFTVTDSASDAEDVTNQQVEQTRAGLMQLEKMQTQAEKESAFDLMQLRYLLDRPDMFTLVSHKARTESFRQAARHIRTLVASYVAKDFGAKLRTAVSSSGEDVDIPFFENLDHLPESMPMDTRVLIATALPRSFAGEVLIGARNVAAIAVLDAFSPQDHQLTLEVRPDERQKHTFFDGREGYISLQQTRIPGVSLKQVFIEGLEPSISFSVYHDAVGHEIHN